MITNTVFFIPRYVAAGRGSARAVLADIIHVAGADMDATYGAYVALENILNDR